MFSCFGSELWDGRYRITRCLWEIGVWNDNKGMVDVVIVRNILRNMEKFIARWDDHVKFEDYFSRNNIAVLPTLCLENDFRVVEPPNR